MATCDNCVKINNLPECIEENSYLEYFMVGLVFTEGDTDLWAVVKDVATNKGSYLSFTTDVDGSASIDLAGIFPLMNHTYKMEFFIHGTNDPADFVITNTDGSTSAGCCIEFNVNIGQVDDNDEFIVSTQNCAV